MGYNNQSSIRDYWMENNPNSPVGNRFFNNIMSFFKWSELFRCFDGDIKFLFIELEKNSQEHWIPSQDVTKDESMIPH